MYNTNTRSSSTMYTFDIGDSTMPIGGTCDIVDLSTIWEDIDMSNITGDNYE